MKIPQSVLEKIGEIEIDDIVGKEVTLKKRGSNLIGLCPFHDEKTPSFTVSPVKGIYKCFGCGKTGDGIKFVREYHSLEFREAVEKICEEYNIDLPKDDSPHAREKEMMIDNIYRANQLAAEAWEEALHTTMNRSMEVFAERGYDEEIMLKWGLGHSDGSFQMMHEALIEKGGMQLKTALEANLMRQKGDKTFDFFINRAIFPIRGTTGKILGFGGRKLIESNDGPKYVNSPDSPVYNKSKSLFGIFHAKSDMRKQEKCYLVEGYTDVIAMHMAGKPNTVAASGTSLTPMQVRLIRRFCNTMILIFDGDKAGEKAATRSIDIALAEGMSVYVCTLPDGHDPDSLIRDRGTAMAADSFDSYDDWMTWKIVRGKATNGWEPEAKILIAKDIMASVRKIKDMVARDVYMRELSKKTGISMNNLIHGETGSGKPRPRKQVQPTASIELEVVRVLFQYGDLKMDDGASVREFVLGNCPHEYFSSEDIGILIQKVAEHPDKNMTVIRNMVEGQEDIIFEALASTIEETTMKHSQDVMFVVYTFCIRMVDLKIAEMIKQMESVDEDKKAEYLQQISAVRKLRGKWNKTLNELA